MSEEIKFKSVPEAERAELTHRIRFDVTTDEKTDGSGNVADAEVSTELDTESENIGSLTENGKSGNNFSFNYNYFFEDARRYTLTATATISYTGTNDTFADVTLEESVDVIIETIPSRFRGSDEVVSQYQGFSNSFEDRAETKIENISTDEQTQLSFNEIDFSPYDNPDIAIDTNARYATHDIIGGTTVRQKIGEDPTEVSVSGVCTERVATQIDQLHKATLVTLFSDRLEAGLRCHVPSTSTNPMDSGGAADMDTGSFIYTFTINLVKIERPFPESEVLDPQPDEEESDDSSDDTEETIGVEVTEEERKLVNDSIDTITEQTTDTLEG